ncbi:nonstructural protein [Rio Claro virus]|uniref:Nonstructural protein n=1 Tax=Rio Claro virus TaxID=2848418 RepID=I1T370_9VIRU|nr:nonstructural protein [Rio Claro virus]AEL29687.1 nonstructural protein [Rio Claro virus]
MNRFMRDMPLVGTTGLSLNRIQVTYIPFNKTWNSPVSTYDVMEFPVHNYTQANEIRDNLQSFYRLNRIPARWGPGFPSIRNESDIEHLSLIHELSKIDEIEIVRHNEPNLKRALYWPFNYPSMSFIRHASRVDEEKPWLFKNNVATDILRASKSTVLDLAIVNLHREVLREAARQSLPEGKFPGKDILMEIASLQCRRMLSAIDSDSEYDGPHSPIFNAVWDYRESCLETVFFSDWVPSVDEFDCPIMHMMRNGLRTWDPEDTEPEVDAASGLKAN